MKFKDYREFIRSVIEEMMKNISIKDWYDLEEINVNQGYIIFHMENFNNTIKIEIPTMQDDKSIYSDPLKIQWATDLKNQLLDVLEHYQKATLQLQEKAANEAIQ